MTAKSFVIYPELMGVKIKYEGGGEVPKELSGDYTDYGTAKRAIARYEENRAPRRKAERPVKKAVEKED